MISHNHVPALRQAPAPLSFVCRSFPWFMLVSCCVVCSLPGSLVVLLVSPGFRLAAKTDLSGL